MSKKKRKHLHKRIWLAPGDPESSAWVAWTIHSYSMDDGDMDIQIADCNRHITLGIYDKQDERKIQRLIDFLEDALAKHKEVRDA